MAKKRKKTGSSSANLSKISTAALQRELERREGELEELEAYHDELLAELAEVDRELKDLGAVVSSVKRTKRASGAKRTYGGGGGKRPHNKWNLEEALARVLRHKTMGVSEVADAVQKAGYKTTSPNFRTIVNQTLLKSKLIKKLGRSAYTAA